MCFQSVAQLSTLRGENCFIKNDLCIVFVLLSQTDPGKDGFHKDGFHKGNCAFQGAIAT